jgi:PAS domain S-box-containing protein
MRLFVFGGRHLPVAAQILSQEVEALKQRLRKLEACAPPADPSKSTLDLAEACEELRATLEELQAAGEELQQQDLELRSAYQAVEAERQRYRDLFETAPDAYLVVDRHGVVREANRTAAELLRVSQRVLIGKPVVVFVPPQDRPGFYDQLDHMAAGDRVQERMLRLQPRRGGPMHIDLTSAAIRDGQGRTTGFRWTLRDRTRAETSKQATEERYRLLVERARDLAMIILDPDGRVASWNRGAERLLGYSEMEIVGEHFSRFYTAEDLQAGRPERELEIARTQGSSADDNWLVRKDGSRFWASGETAALRDPGLRGFAKIVRDLTERKDLEESLLRRAGELAEADQRKDEFLAMLAHELRNPLGPIRNAVQLLRQRDLHTLAWAREVIDRQVRHMARLIDQLLDVSRISRGKILLQHERLDLRALVETVGRDRRPAVEEAGLRFDVQLPPAPVFVRGDGVRLSQVIANLLENAGKFTDRGGWVELRLAAEADGPAAITVRDSGIGIAADLLPHLFETFTQADRSLDRSRGGLGLGLALARGLVELHGGTIEAASPGSGRGSTFTVRLPQASAPPTPAPLPPAAEPAAAHYRILVIDDNHDAADTLRLFLEAYGHEVAAAYDGPSAIQAARQFRPQVVLCDLGLPLMDGFAVARALRQDPETGSARLIALSGYGADTIRQHARETGFELHLVKPVDPDYLQRILTGRS